MLIFTFSACLFKSLMQVATAKGFALGAGILLSVYGFILFSLWLELIVMVFKEISPTQVSQMPRRANFNVHLTQ